MTSEIYKKASEIQAELGNLENKYNTLIRLKEYNGNCPLLKISSRSEILGITFNNEDMISSVINLLMEKIMARINQLEAEFAKL